MKDVLIKEPALVTAVALAVLNLCVGLGYLAEGTSEDIATIVQSVVVLAGGLLVRSAVSPVSRTESGAGRGHNTL